MKATRSKPPANSYTPGSGSWLDHSTYLRERSSVCIGRSVTLISYQQGNTAHELRKLGYAADEFRKQGYAAHELIEQENAVNELREQGKAADKFCKLVQDHARPAGMVDAASRLWMQELKCLQRYSVLVATKRIKIFFKDLLTMLQKNIPKL